MKKILWFDVETTGLDPQRAAIVQFAAIMEIDGRPVDTLNLKVKPFEGAAIDEKALQVNGLSRGELDGFMPEVEAFALIGEFLGKYGDKFSKTDKFYPGGFNVRFDLDFLAAMFRRHGDKYGLGSWVNWRALDPLPILYAMDNAGMLALPNYKLSTVCEHYAIPIQAHEAMSDIMATRVLFRRLMLDATTRLYVDPPATPADHHGLDLSFKPVREARVAGRWRYTLDRRVYEVSEGPWSEDDRFLFTAAGVSDAKNACDEYNNKIKKS